MVSKIFFTIFISTFLCIVTYLMLPLHSILTIVTICTIGICGIIVIWLPYGGEEGDE